MSRQPSLERRHAAAVDQATTAVVAFTSAADSLHQAADALDAVAKEARAIAAEHLDRAQQAGNTAVLNRARAQKIHDLLS